MFALSGSPHALVMNGAVAVPVKKEISSEVEFSRAEELIIPDLVSSEGFMSTVEDIAMERPVKIEPSEESNFMGEDNDLEDPYQCFECGLDCKSQTELIDHYENVHSDESSRKPQYNGNSSPEAEMTDDDPLAGDVAPDSSDKTANVEGAQNDATTREVLLLYSCPCCEHTSIDWNHLAKHMESHIQVNCLSCPKCVYIFSNSYSLKGYTGKDSSDKPHICCHCSFMTQRYQALKDHCVGHHKNLATGNSSSNHDQDFTPANSNLIKKCTQQTISIQAASTKVNSQSENSFASLKLPSNEGQPGYMVFGNSIPGAVVVNNLIPGIHSHGISPFGPPMVHLPLPTKQKEVLGRNCNTISLSVLPDNEIIPRVIPKQQNSESWDAPPKLPLPVMKSANRKIAPKISVNDHKKWTSPNPVSKQAQISLKLPEVSLKPAVPVLLTGMPPNRPPNSTQSRRGVKNKPCPYCSHLARDTHSLKIHILTHTKEKPFACEFCEYRATQRAHIQKHMSTHINGSRRGRNVPLISTQH